MAISFGYAILVVIFNIIADILYATLDPRIKFT
jgi:ABC-type dipeptide/oligopeptide/nickel transport system permease component